MKDVKLEELLTYPEGTLFSVWEPCIARDLCVKGKTLGSTDFWYRSLLPFAPDPDEAPAIDDAEQRWGMYDFAQHFCVYESGDLEKLYQALNEAVVAAIPRRDVRIQ
jgi:hypothetical protein